MGLIGVSRFNTESTWLSLKVTWHSFVGLIRVRIRIESHDSQTDTPKESHDTHKTLQRSVIDTPKESHDTPKESHDTHRGSDWTEKTPHWGRTGYWRGRCWRRVTCSDGAVPLWCSFPAREDSVELRKCRVEVVKLPQKWCMYLRTCIHTQENNNMYSVVQVLQVHCTCTCTVCTPTGKITTGCSEGTKGGYSSPTLHGITLVSLKLNAS